jgi:hypothetical protein
MCAVSPHQHSGHSAEPRLELSPIATAGELLGHELDLLAVVPVSVRLQAQEFQLGFGASHE